MLINPDKSKTEGSCKNCTGLLKRSWLTKDLFHAETGMTNCPFSHKQAEQAQHQG